MKKPVSLVEWKFVLKMQPSLIQSVIEIFLKQNPELRFTKLNELQYKLRSKASEIRLTYNFFSSLRIRFGLGDIFWVPLGKSDVWNDSSRSSMGR